MSQLAFGRRLPPLLRETTFRRYWWGRSLSLLGDQVGMLAFPLTAVLVLKTSAIGMAALLAVGSLPSLLFAVHVGALVEHRPSRRRIMIVADLVRAGLLAAIPVSWLLGFLTLPVLVTVWFLTGLASLFFRVAAGTVFVAMVPPDRYTEANGLLEQSRAGGFLIGPALAGWLIEVFTAPFALLADAASFLASAVSLMAIHPQEPQGPAPTDRNVWGGFSLLWTSVILRAMFAAQLTQSLFRAVFMAIYVLYGTRYLHITPAQWGLILGPSSILAIVGSVSAGRLVRGIGLGPALIVGFVLFNAPLLVVPLLSGAHALVVGSLFLVEGAAGAGSMIRAVTVGTIQAAAIPNAARARVMGAFSLASNGMTPVGAAITALLAWLAGVHDTLWVGAIGMAAAPLWLVVPRILRLADSAELSAEVGELVSEAH